MPVAQPERFPIGAVAQMFHLSVSTLRKYEKMGLLTPEYIAPDSGYRYYGVRQFEVLNTIRYLRALDMPIPQIADFLRNRDVPVIAEKLRAQKDAVARKQQELAKIERKIDRRLVQLHDAQTAPRGVIGLEDTPPCRIAWIAESLRIRGPLDMETPIRRLGAGEREAVVFLGKVGVGISAAHLQAGAYEQYDRVFLVLDDDEDFAGATEVLPAAQCAAVRFCGSHREAPAQYARLAAFLQQNELEFAGFSREITLIDSGFTADPAQFVTEIHVPVWPKNLPKGVAVSAQNGYNIGE